MPMLIECPTCDRRISIPEEAAGKKVQCPGCDGFMTIPDLEAFEEVAAPAPKKRPSLNRNDDDRPRRSPRRRDEEEDDDDRPRRRRQDEDDRPRRKAPLSQNAKIGMYAGGGVALMLVLFGALWGFGAFQKAGSGSIKGGPPSGWVKLEDAEFTCFTPGRADAATVGGNPGASSYGIGAPDDPSIARVLQYWCKFNKDDTDFTVDGCIYKDRTVGTTEAFLLAEGKRAHCTGFAVGDDNDWYALVEKNIITVGGRTVLEIKTIERDRMAPKPGAKDPFDTPFFNGDDPNKRKNELAAKAREFAKRQKHCIIRVVADGKRAFVLGVSSTGQEPDPGMVKTFFDSFEPR